MTRTGGIVVLTLLMSSPPATWGVPPDAPDSAKSAPTSAPSEPSAAPGNASNMAAIPFDFKGDQLGMSLREFQVKHDRPAEGDPKRLPFCRERERSNLTICELYFPFERRTSDRETVAGVAATIVFGFYDGRLTTISAHFSSSSFETVRQAIAAKYGPPSSSRDAVYQNGFGATRTGEVLSWTNGVSRIELEQFSGSVNSSSLTYVHAELESAWQKARSKAARKAATDL